jgi:putative ABC transport system permease protein
MRLLEYLDAALAALVRHATRTLLTMLGIIFGVGAVISMLSIGAGAQAEALEVIDAMGLRNVIVRDRPPQQRDLQGLREKSLGLSLRDLEGLLAVATDVTGASPKKRVRVDRVLSASGRSDAQVLGVGRAYFELLGLEIAEGALFDAEEERTLRRACVLGSRARDDLFAFAHPLGQPVKIGDAWFTVVGTLRPQALAKDAFQGVAIESADASVFIPVGAALQMYDAAPLASELDEVVLQVRPGGSIETASAVTTRVLSELHGGADDFTVVVPQELLEQAARTRRIFNVVMGGIAGISLLVGGIGIMNIMLAGVLERTREIGIRRAVGARRSDILSQFLSEAVLISVLGGLLGVVLGVSIAWGVAAFSQWNTVVTGLSILVSFGFSLLVGLVFGTYPAMNAARLDPIEALRYE